MILRERLNRAAKVLKEAEALLITAGAGMGVDSGLPDFRGEGGFWKAYPVMAKLRMSFVEMANPEWFHREPELAWAFYGHRLNLYRETVPHAGFKQLLEAGRRMPGGYFVFTSNVDGHFQKAGFDEERVKECHGSIHYLQCIQPCCDDIWSAEDVRVEVDEEVFRAEEPLPRCIRCGRIARPNILMFGDWSWNPARTDVQGKRLYRWLRETGEKGHSLAIVEIGAGKAVATVRYQSEHLANLYKGTLIRINPRDYDVPGDRHISLPLKGAEGINGFFELLDKA